jgi:hypothetical protein
MKLGTSWLQQAERAAAARASEMVEAAERRLGELLPDGMVERDGLILRISARRLIRRWVAEPALRFLAWTLK